MVSFKKISGGTAVERIRGTGLQSTGRVNKAKMCCECCPKEYTPHYMSSAEPAQVLRETMTQLEPSFRKMALMARDKEE